MTCRPQTEKIHLQSPPLCAEVLGFSLPRRVSCAFRAQIDADRTGRVSRRPVNLPADAPHHLITASCLCPSPALSPQPGCATTPCCAVRTAARATTTSDATVPRASPASCAREPAARGPASASTSRPGPPSASPPPAAGWRSPSR